MTNIFDDGLEELAGDLVGRQRVNAAGERVLPVPEGEREVVEFSSMVDALRATSMTRELNRPVLFVLPSWAKGYVRPPRLARAWPACDVEILGDRRYSAAELRGATTWEELGG